MLEKYLDIRDDIKKAIAENKPVVALESTILSHGMPYPENLEFARNVEKIIIAEGAVPATIAIIGGKIKVGLSDEELELMCKAENVGKVSRRDLPIYIATKQTGATTVTTTMIGASLAGIKFFATGGLGGVHREAQQTFDISADLQELANTNVAVVCAGAKAILDLNLTMEYLETFGVPVLGLRTDYLPAFYSKSSGLKLDHNCKDEQEVADIVKAKWELGLNGGVVIGNPIPDEYAMPNEEINVYIEKALAMAKEKGIKGKDTTPFLLATVKDLTGGDSLKSNIELAYNNARACARIAKAYFA